MSNELNSAASLLPKFSYDSLPSTTSIRLLNLQQESQEDYAQIETYRLEKAPPFTALSYTWGCPFSEPNYELEDVNETTTFNAQYTSKHDIPIRCNSASIIVTKNSKEAIDHIKQLADRLGLFDNTLYLWVDAICINQEDLDERAAQVKIMSQIYSTARHVFIWLGKCLARTANAVGLIGYLSTIPKERYHAMRHHELIFEDTYQALDMEPVPVGNWRILSSFLQRNWFRRVWTVQEFGLSRSHTILCGERTLSWEALLRVSEMLVHTGWSNQLYSLDYFIESCDKARVLAGEISTGSATEQTKGRLMELLEELNGGQHQSSRHINNGGPGFGPFITMVLKSALVYPYYKHDLLTIIQLTISKDATDARDKIYAFLDVINRKLEKHPEAGVIVPSYAPSNSVQLVYTDFAYRAIQADGNLFALLLINDEVFRGIAGLPSWVPDLCEKRHAEVLFHPTWSPFLDRDAHYAPPTLLGKYSLRVQGIRVDYIVERALPYRYMGQAQVVAWLKLAASLEVSYPTNQGPAEVLWRTLIADTCEDESPARSTTGENFAFYLFKCLLQPRDLEEHMQEFKDAMVLLKSLKAVDPNGVRLSDEDILNFIDPALHPRLSEQDRVEALEKIWTKCSAFGSLVQKFSHGRRLFLTREKKYLGLGSLSLQIEDEVWLLPRATSPVVLRRLSNGHFTVVGAAYVPGIMRGEGVIGRLEELQDITLD
jgi:hypothetical protein